MVLPAFGVTTAEMQRFSSIGCVMVDTTCGSVLNVWKNVKRYSQEGLTSVIHGKVWHEETQATASHALDCAGGHFLVVLDLNETAEVCRYIREGGDRNAFLERFRDAVSPGFDPDRDLAHIGLANQTTMLMSESLQVQELLRQAIVDRYGPDEAAARFRAFDTICSATQDRQDAVVALLREQADRPHAGHRRLQQQQHLQSRANLCRKGAHVPHCRPRMPAVGDDHPLQASRWENRGGGHWMAPPSGKRVGWANIWGFDSRQSCRNGGQAARCALQLVNTLYTGVVFRVSNRQR